MNYEKVIMAIAVLSFVFSVGLSGAQAKSMKDLQNRQKDSKRAELILESIETSNYENWRKLVNSNSKIAQTINKEDFDKFVKARNFARQGKYEEALELYERIKDDLGLSDENINRIAVLVAENNHDN